jgi:hypothetical protein
MTLIVVHVFFLQLNKTPSLIEQVKADLFWLQIDSYPA